jgi:hypothetical protein
MTKRPARGVLGSITPAFPKALWICRCAWTNAGASPTTPQGPQQRAADIKKREKELGFGQSMMRQQEQIW